MIDVMPKNPTQSGRGGLIIQGVLEETPLPETVQFLAGLKKTGHLAIERDQPHQTAQISFRKGDVVHAICPPLRGEAAFTHLISWRTGRYIFLNGLEPREQTIQRDTQGLLMDGMRVLDEVLRSETGLPPRDSVLYRSRSSELTMSLHELRIWRLFDGERSVGAVLDMDPGQSPTIAHLVANGALVPQPDDQLLDRVVLRQTPRGMALVDKGGTDAAASLVRACDGRRPLASIRAQLGGTTDQVLQTAGYLIAAGYAQAVAGADDLDHLI